MKKLPIVIRYTRLFSYRIIDFKVEKGLHNLAQTFSYCLTYWMPKQSKLLLSTLNFNYQAFCLFCFLDQIKIRLFRKTKQKACCLVPSIKLSNLMIRIFFKNFIERTFLHSRFSKVPTINLILTSFTGKT